MNRTKGQLVQGIKTGYVSVKQAEAYTGISRWTWRKWALEGRVASVKLGSRLLLPMSEIERLLAANTRPAIEGGR